jgi:hypothetical protein
VRDSLIALGVVKDDVSIGEGGDQEVAGEPVAALVELRCVQVTADVGSVGRLQPIPLAWTRLPPEINHRGKLPQTGHAGLTMRALTPFDAVFE